LSMPPAATAWFAPEPWSSSCRPPSRTRAPRRVTARGAARGDAPSSEHVERLASTVLRRVRRLRALVDDMLDVSRMNAGKLALRLEQVDLSCLVGAELESRADELRAGGYAVTAGIEPEIVGRWDQQRVEQVVANLLTNAVPVRLREPHRRGAVARRREGQDCRARSRDRDRRPAASDPEQALEVLRTSRAGSARLYVDGLLSSGVGRRMLAAG
jgi:hypothetical protein